MNIVVIWGGAVFFLYLYMLQSFVLRWRFRPARSESLLNVPLVVFVGLNAYLLLYVVFSRPEGRYAAPAVPALVTRTDWTRLPTALRPLVRVAAH